MYISYSSSQELSSSYIGGKPMLPDGVQIPKHPKTKSQMTFFFQILMPDTHEWAGQLISIFCVTDDYDPENIIPEMIEYNRSNYDVRSDCQQFNQNYFKVIVSDFKSCKVKDEYKEIIEYKPLIFRSEADNAFSFIGGTPNWIIEDESPTTLDGKKIDFLFQTSTDLYFSKLSCAPKQKIEDFEKSSGIRDSYIDDYSLFAGNAIYFFGEKTTKRVYMVLQS